MIIANIGHRKFELSSMEDAETLLKIFNNAKEVDDDYRLDRGNRYYYVSAHFKTSFLLSRSP